MSEDTRNGARPDGDATPAESAAPEGGGDLARRLDEITRAYAELVNDREAFKRRLDRERERLLEAQKGEIARVLLDTLDELAMAVRGSSAGEAALADGLRLIAENVGKRVEALGLARVPAEGHLFDPSLHEAIDLLPTPDAALDGRVVEEVRAGWKLGDRVIRAARVRVGRLVPAPAPAGDGAPGAPSGE